MSEIIQTLDLEAPTKPTDAQYQQAEAELLQNVSDGLVDPLDPLTTQTIATLGALAYTDPLRTELLERRVRAKLRDRNDSERSAAKFNLSGFRKAAKMVERDLQAAVKRREMLARRNMGIIEGGQGDPELQKLNEETQGSVGLDTQARMFSSSNFHKAIAQLQAKRKGRVWYDDFYKNFYSDWDGTSDDAVRAAQPLDEEFYLNLWDWVMLQDVKLASMGKTTAVDAAQAFAFTDKRDEPRDWVNGLKWDGTPRLDTWLCKAFSVEDDEYHRAVGRNWLVAIIARVMQHGAQVDTMPVLQGPQGTRKSTALEALGGKWYRTINVNADKNADFAQALNGLLIAELAELDAISEKRADNRRIKAMITTREDHYRPPYGKTTQTFPRTAILVGTTNEPDWHRDDTGGRRFWPIICGTLIDVQWIRDNREQLFAEAFAAHQRGELWWEVPDEEQKAHVGQFTIEDPWLERIASWIAANSHSIYTGAEGNDVKPTLGDPDANEAGAYWGTLLTTNRVLVEALQIQTAHLNQSHSRKVNRVLSQLGFAQTRLRVPCTNGVSERVKFWAVPTPKASKEG